MQKSSIYQREKKKEKISEAEARWGQRMRWNIADLTITKVFFNRDKEQLWPGLHEDRT